MRWRISGRSNCTQGLRRCHSQKHDVKPCPKCETRGTFNRSALTSLSDARYTLGRHNGGP